MSHDHSGCSSACSYKAPRPPEGKLVKCIECKKSWLPDFFCFETLAVCDQCLFVSDEVIKRVDLHAKLVAAVENMILMLQGIARERGENAEEWANYRRLKALLREAAK